MKIWENMEIMLKKISVNNDFILEFSFYVLNNDDCHLYLENY